MSMLTNLHICEFFFFVINFEFYNILVRKDAGYNFNLKFIELSMAQCNLYWGIFQAHLRSLCILFLLGKV